MLTRLSVDNYALIDGLEMELSPSLNIITGETGAGKSILLGALGLILGNRADIAALKDNGRNCVIEGIFDISTYGLEGFFAGNELEYDPSTVIRRVITPAGKSRAYVNDLPVQLSTLRDISVKLIDVHSQHQSLMLADESFRTGIVDSIAGTGGAMKRYRELYSSLRGAERELADLRAETERSKRDEDYLRFQHEQIAALRLKEGEQEELEAEQRELANAEQIQGALAASAGMLDEDDTGILPRLKAIENGLSTISQVYPRGGELAARVRSVLVELKDISSELFSEAGRVEGNPARLAEVDARMNTVWSLLRKHRLASSDELMALEKELSAKLGIISSSDESICALEAKISEIRALATAEAAGITSARMAAAEKLSAGVESSLERLGMPASRFLCEITPLRELSATGADEIRFLFSANRNAPPYPLEKIASGGEVSRVMLTLKSLVSRSKLLPTIIFDEIDTGVSGRIADAMGDIIAELAAHMQVVNITHLPQVASKGDTHFLVYKEDTPLGVQTRIRRLSPGERTVEIAKMLSGSHVTDAAITQAKTLLGQPQV